MSVAQSSRRANPRAGRRDGARALNSRDNVVPQKGSVIGWRSCADLSRARRFVSIAMRFAPTA
ncbi:MAG: hypothetical protein ACJA0P_000540 [Planctomycetota bacterium]|jgi:hypothetical protein